MHTVRSAAAVLAAVGFLFGGLAAASPLTAQATSDQTGCLSFHEVHPAITAPEAARTQVPGGFRIYPLANLQDEQLLLRETPVLSGGEVADAHAGFDARTTQPIVSFRFNAEGARKLAQFTKDNLGRPFAIVLNGRVISAPVIREPILGSTGQISGNFTVADAHHIAAKLKSGTCP